MRTPRSSFRPYAAIACLLVLAAGAATARRWEEEDFAERSVVAYPFNPPRPGLPRERVRTVIGETRTYRATRGDTFFDLARHFDLGHNELAAANPGVDEWLPDRADAPILIPTSWVLPCCHYRGIVINIPEMRLYYYPPRRRREEPRVITFPVGLGRVEWRTPLGKFRVRDKTVDPTWVIPESIRKERIEERGSSERMIPGGSPDNPLGRYRMRLSIPLYAIHGTNIPWGVGMSVSHGCIRLYPEDIEELFPMIPVGTPGEFVYETVKVGLRDGDVFVEVHEDLYGLQPGPWRRAIELLEEQELLDLVDRDKLLQAVSARSGVPEDVTRRSARAADLPTETLGPASAAPPAPALPAPAG